MGQLPGMDCCHHHGHQCPTYNMATLQHSYYHNNYQDYTPQGALQPLSSLGPFSQNDSFGAFTGQRDAFHDNNNSHHHHSDNSIISVVADDMGRDGRQKNTTVESTTISPVEDSTEDYSPAPLVIDEEAPQSSNPPALSDGRSRLRERRSNCPPRFDLSCLSSKNDFQDSSTKSSSIVSFEEQQRKRYEQISKHDNQPIDYSVSGIDSGDGESELQHRGKPSGPTCLKCREGHPGVVVLRKNHVCPVKFCKCLRCQLVDEKRKNLAESQKHRKRAGEYPVKLPEIGPPAKRMSFHPKSFSLPVHLDGTATGNWNLSEPRSQLDILNSEARPEVKQEYDKPRWAEKSFNNPPVQRPFKTNASSCPTVPFPCTEIVPERARSTMLDSGSFGGCGSDWMVPGSYPPKKLVNETAVVDFDVNSVQLSSPSPNLFPPIESIRKSPMASGVVHYPPLE